MNRIARQRWLVAVSVAVVLLAAYAMFLPMAAVAQSFSLDLGPGASSTGRIVQLIALITILSLAPSILVMVTSFTRIIVVLSFLRSAMGVQQTPPNTVLVSLALFLTAFVMSPILEKSYQEGLAPLIANQINEEEAFSRSLAPVHAFMMRHVRARDLQLFMDMSAAPAVAQPEDTPLRSLVPAFMISELRRAFEIGFLIFVPFLVIDMVVASVLMSMGMMMLPPVMISLPFKLIFFVLVDGWHMIAGSLVQSYGGG